MDDPAELHQLGPGDVPMMETLLATFGNAFNDPETYTAKPPGEGYLRRLLSGDSFIALAALKRGHIRAGR